MTDQMPQAEPKALRFAMANRVLLTQSHAVLRGEDGSVRQVEVVVLGFQTPFGDLAFALDSVQAGELAAGMLELATASRAGIVLPGRG